MGGFDIFSQLQGPTVPISLYGEAAKTGVAIGKELGTPLTAGIEGAIKGYQQGQEIQKTDAQIDQIRAETEKAQLQNQILQTKAQANSLTQDSQLQLAQVQAQNDLQEAQQQNEIITTKRGIADKLSSSDQATRLSILSDPKAQTALLSDSKYATAVYGRLAADMTDEQKNRALASIDFVKERELANQRELIKEKEKQLDAVKLDKLVRDVKDDGQLSYLMNSNNLNLFGLNNVETYPSGVKSFNPDGTINKSATDKSQADPANLDAKPGKYDVVINGKRAPVLLDETSNKTLYAWKNSGSSLGLFSKPQNPVTILPPNAANQDKPFSAPFQPIPGSTPTATATPGATPPPQNFSVPGSPTSSPEAAATPLVQENISSAGNNIVEQRLAALKEKANSDPDLRNRLIAKGILKYNEATPAPTPTVTPQATEVSPLERSTNRGTVAPSETAKPQNISAAIDSLSAGAKKHVEASVVKRVAGSPYLQGLDPLFQAVAATESAGNENAKSPTGPEGLFQLSKATAQDLGVDRSDPEQNVQGGIAYVNQLLARYGGRKIPALMAYNVEPSVIDAAISLTNSDQYEDLVYALNYFKEKGFYKNLLTSSKIKETSKYPIKVLAYEEAFGNITHA